MSNITAAAAREVTEKFISLYLDPDRLTQDELASLKAGRAPEECSLVDELDAAVRADDYFSPEEVSQMRFLPDFIRHEFETKYASRLRYGWLNGVASHVLHRFGHRDMSAADQEKIAAAFAELDVASFPKSAQSVLVYLQTIASLNVMANGAREMIKSYITLADNTVKLARDNMKFKITIINAFGTPAQRREENPKMRAEFRAERAKALKSRRQLIQCERQLRTMQRRNWAQPKKGSS